MVQDSGKALCAVAVKPVNTPEPIAVEESEAGLPVAVRLKRRQIIKSIEDKWRIDDEWWRSEPVSRFYYAVLFASGQRLVIYKDLNTGKWYKQAY
jgi:hypothetical protein